MKFTIGQLLAIAITVLAATVFIYDAPFEAAAAVAASASQVVYAPVFNPPVIGGVAGKIDYELLLLELAFVAFVGCAIFFAVSQNRKDK